MVGRLGVVCRLRGGRMEGRGVVDVSIQFQFIIPVDKMLVVNDGLDVNGSLQQPQPHNSQATVWSGVQSLPTTQQSNTLPPLSINTMAPSTTTSNSDSSSDIIAVNAPVAEAVSVAADVGVGVENNVAVADINANVTEAPTRPAAAQQVAAAPSNANDAREEEDDDDQVDPYSSNIPASFCLLVSPGRLGLSLTFDSGIGAVISAIDPACTFKGQIQVGDRIITVDGITVKRPEDLVAGKDKVRQFGVVVAPKKDGDDSEKPASSTTKEKATTTSKLLTSTNKPNSNHPVGHEETQDNVPYYESHNWSRGYGRIPFPELTRLGLLGDDRNSEQMRQDLMSEVIHFNKQKKVNTIAKISNREHQVVCVPMSNSHHNGFNEKAFSRYLKHTGVMDQFMGGWSQYCDGNEDMAAELILRHLAKKYPTTYVKHFDTVTKELNGGDKKPAVELPPDFVSHDGTNDIKWNAGYSELLKWCEEYGNHAPYPHTKNTPLGRWITQQRSKGRDEKNPMNERRQELLNAVNFTWSGLPEGDRKQIVRGGDPQFCRALASKMVFPQLTMRECFYLGGYTDEELDQSIDEKHAWRTGYVRLKDKMNLAIKKWETARKAGARKQTEQLISTLKGTDENRFEVVFGEYHHYLPQFLEKAEERKRNGIPEERPRPRQKRTHEHVDEAAAAGYAHHEEVVMDGDYKRSRVHESHEQPNYYHEGQQQYYQQQAHW
eukprot:scaffold32_cov190-Alexandrium_tamarense.AAC.8